MRPRPYMILLLCGALLGLLFASFSTYDFVRHLDRQVHSLHCSFLPGIAAADASDASGCKVTMMSPYSSVFRAWVWGGLPITLPGMAVFAFILFVGVELTLGGRQQDPRAVGFLMAASALPVLASVIMASIAIALGAACKLCIAIYLASAICLGGAIPLWLQARKAARGQLPPPRQPAKQAGPARERSRHDTEPMWVRSLDGSDAGEDPEPALAVAPQPDDSAPPAAATPVSYRHLAVLGGIGVLFVALPVVAYLIAVPDYSSYVGACGRLARPGDRYRVMVPLGQQQGGTLAIEVLDPLCPACAAFEDRLEASGLDRELDRRLLLFPLDTTCNWMVDDAIHPGACTVSEAVLCAGRSAEAVVRWAFTEHERIRAAAARDPGAARRMVAARFPALVKCLGSPAVRSKLNKSLRWAVQNQLPVLTPQLYIDGRRLCDEDVDLGMDYALSRMLQRHEGAVR